MILKTINTTPDLPFQAWRRNVYSQTGEDGIIEELFRIIGCTHGYFVEFGGWDGRHLSNSAKLADEGWNGCFIEGSAERFKDLEANYNGHENISRLNAYVEAKGGNSLDQLLTKVDAPTQFELLSIDIDGNDYHVLDGLYHHKPKLMGIIPLTQVRA